MQEVIDTMTAGKTDEVLPRRRRVERVIVGGYEIIDKTDEIACRIGDIHVNPQLQQVIDAIMNGCRYHTIDAEAKELGFFVSTMKYALFYHCMN